MIDDSQRVLRRLVGVDGSESLSGIDARALAETQGDDERTEWDLFYDVVDVLEKAIAEGDQEALALRDAARNVVQTCRITPAAE